MKILVPIDFSTYSFNAIEMAKIIQQVTSAELTLLHVIDRPEGADSAVADLRQKEQAEKRMGEMTTLPKGTRTIVMVGYAFKVIQEMTTNTDLMIIGESGQTDDSHFFMGSLADRLVRSAICPVLTVNEQMGLPLQRIVYATDLKEDHPALMQTIKQFQEWFNAELHVVKINTRDQFMSDLESRELLNAWKDRYELTSCELHVYNHEDEELGIIYFAEQVHADMIALGVHKRSRFQQVISGGPVAQEVSDHTRRPVLTMLFEEE